MSAIVVVSVTGRSLDLRWLVMRFGRDTTHFVMDPNPFSRNEWNPPVQLVGNTLVIDSSSLRTYIADTQIIFCITRSFTPLTLVGM